MTIFTDLRVPGEPGPLAPGLPRAVGPKTIGTAELPIAGAVAAPAHRMGNPSADCIADSAGGLTFDIAENRRFGAADTWDSALVLRRRGVHSATDELRLPLVPAGEGRLRAVLPSTVVLPEGRWDAFAATAGDGEPQRLVPGINDLRALVDRCPAPGRATVAVRIPYTTKYGNLSVRGWLRSPHAEAGEIRVSGGGMTVRGLLFGAVLGRRAVVVARSRRVPSLIRTVPVSGEGTLFGFALSYRELAEMGEGGSQAWDLWLRLSDRSEDEPVRIARILDDIPDKRHIFSYPVQSLAASHGPVVVGPCYTADNGLAVRISEAP